MKDILSESNQRDIVGAVSFAADQIKVGFQQDVIQELSRPCVIHKPSLSKDGDKWLAILGDLPTGVVGVGDTPAKAMWDFDRAWHKN